MARENPRFAAVRRHAAARFGTRSSSETVFISPIYFLVRCFWKYNTVSSTIYASVLALSNSPLALIQQKHRPEPSAEAFFFMSSCKAHHHHSLQFRFAFSCLRSRNFAAECRHPTGAPVTVRLKASGEHRFLVRFSRGEVQDGKDRAGPREKAHEPLPAFFVWALLDSVLFFNTCRQSTAALPNPNHFIRLSVTTVAPRRDHHFSRSTACANTKNTITALRYRVPLVSSVLKYRSRVFVSKLIFGSTFATLSN